MKKLSLMFYLICFSTIYLKAQTVTNKIEVIGQAEIEVVPDYFEYNINLQEYYKSENEKVAIEILEKGLVKAVEEIGLGKNKLTINSLNGNKRYAGDNKPSNFLESRNYILRINSINDINNLLPKLDKLGLVSTSMSKKTNSKKTEYEKELRKKAVNDARQKATSIAESVGKKIGNIILISENNFNGLSLNFEDLTDFVGKAAYFSNFKTDIEVEKIKLSYQVRITFQMK
ncbi:MAG: SIMPL domain-containing protein [Arcicella sp.]|nr:SIMPL domain-containing protein [Arcicella sp.]